MAWQIVDNNDQISIIDDKGNSVAHLPVTSTLDKQTQFANAALMAAAPELLKVCKQSDNYPLPESLRHLAGMLRSLAQAPVKLPLDQLTRLNNDLNSWEHFLDDLANQVESVCDKMK